MSRKIWQPAHPTPGWLQAAQESDLTIHLPHPDGDVPMFFRRIPAGEFRMGSRGNDPSEEPVHLVKIPHDFYLGTFPVTQAQYRAIAGACLDKLQAIDGNKGIDPSHFKGDLRPVETVSWDDTMAVLVSKSVRYALEQAGLPPEKWHACLPNEAHWEYACRAGTETDYWSGDGEAALAEVGWYEENSGNETHPVGQFTANPLGLHDVHCNVLEWCADVWDNKPYRKRVDGWTAEAWIDKDWEEDEECWIEVDFRGNLFDRVIRGGCWSFRGKRCRSHSRDLELPDDGDELGGFRLCVFPNPGDVNQSQEVEKGADVSSFATAKEDKTEDGAPPQESPSHD